MLTQDEALVDINLAVQYRRSDPVKFAFNVRDPEQTLGDVSESAMKARRKPPNAHSRCSRRKFRQASAA
ncbi:FtsH protease regulator HflK [compost metagenome]